MEMEIEIEIPLHAGFDPISDLVSEEAKAGCERKEISCHLLNLFLFRKFGWSLKFGNSEKDTKLEEIFHLKFDVTQ